MVLIQCPECQKEISDKVKNRPHCGFPIEQNKKSKGITDENELLGGWKLFFFWICWVLIAKGVGYNFGILLILTKVSRHYMVI